MRASTTLVGRLTREPKAFGTEGKEVALMSVACGEGKTKKTDFFIVRAFGRTAVNACKYLDKGSLVAIEASLRTYKNEKFKDEAGHSPEMVELIASKIEYLSGGKKPQTSQEPVQAPSNDEGMTIDDIDW